MLIRALTLQKVRGSSSPIRQHRAWESRQLQVSLGGGYHGGEQRLVGERDGAQCGRASPNAHLVGEGLERADCREGVVLAALAHGDVVARVLYLSTTAHTKSHTHTRACARSYTGTH